MIIDAYYRSLTHLPAATNLTCKLRQCYDSMERHLRSLEALGEDVEDRHFITLITEKLPQKVLYQLYMLKAEKEWTVAKLRELLCKHITAMEVAGGDIRPPPASHGNRQTQNPREPRIHNQLPPNFWQEVAAQDLLQGSEIH